ncbi:hypothetical protein LTR12_012448 [Friedmanniomyces endolithicus]|nr:hypothetical protein LTR12_012448 [Friedmanniomyces endolithicus]
MTHRQLAEKYAKQAHDATQRIVELENEVADVRVRLEQTAAVNEGLSKQGNDCGTVRDQLMTAVLQIKELGCTIASHQNQLKAKQNDADAMAKDLQEQRAIAEEARNDRVWEEIFDEERRAVDAIAKRDYDVTKAELTATNAGLVAKNTELVAKASELTVTRGRLTATNAELFATKKERASLRCQATKFGKLKESLDTRAAALTREVDRVGRGKSDKENEIRKMGGLLDREKKRRLEAEAMLGPDGQRCRKCNPEVIDLEHDTAQETTIAHPNIARQSHRHQEGVTSAARLPPTASLAGVGGYLAELAYGPAGERIRPVPGYLRVNGGWQLDIGASRRRLGPWAPTPKPSNV